MNDRLEKILFNYHVEKVLASKYFYWYHYLLATKEALYLGNYLSVESYCPLKIFSISELILRSYGPGRFVHGRRK